MTPRTRPEVEALDTRIVPAVADIQIFLRGRTLVVQGTNDPEQILIQNGRQGVGVFVGEENERLQLFAIMPSRFVNVVQVYGRGGDDNISMINEFAFNPVTNQAQPSALTIPAMVFGGDGNDTIQGGLGNDTLRGMQGNDEVSGGGGNDKIFGGQGNDTLAGGAGRDSLFGEAGDDVMSGGVGNDLLNGGPGADAMSGNENDDSLIGGPGKDRMNGGTGLDTLKGIDGFADILAGSSVEDIFLPDALDKVRIN